MEPVSTERAAPLADVRQHGVCRRTVGEYSRVSWPETRPTASRSAFASARVMLRQSGTVDGLATGRDVHGDDRAGVDDVARGGIGAITWSAGTVSFVCVDACRRQPEGGEPLDRRLVA